MKKFNKKKKPFSWSWQELQIQRNNTQRAWCSARLLFVLHKTRISFSKKCHLRDSAMLWSPLIKNIYDAYRYDAHRYRFLFYCLGGKGKVIYEQRPIISYLEFQSDAFIHKCTMLDKIIRGNGKNYIVIFFYRNDTFSLSVEFHSSFHCQKDVNPVFKGIIEFCCRGRYTK